jgi:VanZ family protein
MKSSQSEQHREIMERVLRFLAWASIFTLVVLTVVPANDRPTTPAPHNIEHIAAFAVSGTLVGLSFRSRLWVLLVAAIAFAAALELIQLGLPTRHSRLSDFFENCVGSWIGLVIGHLLSKAMKRRFQGG